jgi:hypothetical protein
MLERRIIHYFLFIEEFCMPCGRAHAADDLEGVVCSNPGVRDPKKF